VQSLRRCVACRQVYPQSEMLRIARINNEYFIDKNFKLNGRGANICNKKECINLTIKKRLLNKSYKANLGAEIYDKLSEHVSLEIDNKK